MSSLSDLLQEKGKISEQLQLLNRHVDDLSLDELKNIISMRERLKEIVYALENMKSGIAGRIDAIDLLVIDLIQKLEDELSKIRNNLAVSDNKNIDKTMNWLDALEKRLNEVIDCVRVAEDIQTRQAVEIRFEGNIYKHDAIPGQISAEENCDYKRKDSKKETKKEKTKPDEEKSFKSVANNLKKLDCKPNVTKKLDLSKNMQVSIGNKYEAGEMIKDIFGITIGNYLPEENEVKIIKDFVKSKKKLQHEITLKNNSKLEAAENINKTAESPKKCLNNRGDKKASTIKNPDTLKEIGSLVSKEFVQHNKQIIGMAEVEVAAAQSEMMLPEVVLPSTKDSSTRGRRKSSRTKSKANSKKRSISK